MKTTLLIYLLFQCLITFNLSAQENEYFFGAEANYSIPIASFSDRFENSVGATIYIGKIMGPNFSWLGKIDYIKFDNINSEALNKKVSSEINEVETVFDIPLNNLGMEFETFGVSVEACVNLLRTDFNELSFSVGFGFYHWENYRASYIDTITFVSEASTTPIVIHEFDVPKNKQDGWSGALNFGLETNFNIIGPVQLSFASHYKIIIDELWPTLALDIESVSGIQFMSLCAGLRYNL